MTQVVIEDLEPGIAEKLKIRALTQGRTLEAEIKAILKAATEAEVVEKAATMAEAWERIDKARAKYAGRIFSDSVELLREDRNR